MTTYSGKSATYAVLLKKFQLPISQDTREASVPLRSPRIFGQPLHSALAAIRKTCSFSHLQQDL